MPENNKSNEEIEFKNIKYVIQDKKYRFLTWFDMATGNYLRSNVFGKDGMQTDEEPFMASFPHLIDVGIMGHCIHGKTGLCAKAGIGCYQSGMIVEKPNMSLQNFQKIAQQCRGRCNQFALGGRGDPDQHEDFEEILKCCRANMIVPNFTTSGYGMTKEIAELCKKYCGAVAVSWYRNNYTTGAIQMLLDAGVKTNIHYVVGNNSIDEAIRRLKENDFPAGINAVIFLIHKPVGQGSAQNVLQADDPRVAEFFQQIEEKHQFKVGLDSCSSPGVVNFTKKVDMDSIDTCEGGRFSCYIGSDMKMVPCSFDQSDKYAVMLDESTTIEDAWNSDKFELFRNHLRHSCPTCPNRAGCMGGCPLQPSIVLCKKEEKNIIIQ